MMPSQQISQIDRYTNNEGNPRDGFYTILLGYLVEEYCGHLIGDIKRMITPTKEAINNGGYKGCG